MAEQINEKELTYLQQVLAGEEQANANLQAAQEALSKSAAECNAAMGARKGFGEYLEQVYELKQGDSIDSETGVIERGNA